MIHSPLQARPPLRRRWHVALCAAAAAAALLAGACARGALGDLPADAGGLDVADDASDVGGGGDGSGADASDAALDASEDGADDIGSVNNGVIVACIVGQSRLCTSSCGTEGVQFCAGERFGPCEPPAEDCNGRDDDCDGQTDEGLGSRACSSACGGGDESCQGGVWTGCNAVNPADEACNAADDDCDSRLDESLTQPCATACGSGVETCLGGAFLGCTAPIPQLERCDGADNDCNGQTDEGLTRSCSTACGEGVERCQGGAFGGCNAPTPSAEQCDGADNDCDGTTDEGLTRPCSTACGEGNERCQSGAWTGCTAPAPAAESCNNSDDDCDGTIDEGHRVQPRALTYAQLSAAQAPCVSSSSRLDVCLTAAHRHCAASASCLTSGAGPADPQGSSASVVCLGRGAQVRGTTRAEVAAASGITITDQNISTRIAQSACSRWCRAEGFEGGIGPVEHGDPSVAITCVSRDIARLTEIPTAELNGLGCFPLSDADPIACASAANAACQGRGWAFGHGPVEWNAMVSHVLCLGE